MLELHPEYLADLARQIAFVCAFLGGCSATFLAGILAVSARGRAAGVATVAAAVASVTFALGAMAAIMLTAALHPSAPTEAVTGPGALRARLVMVAGMLLGTYGLLLTIGSSGWIRSRRVGIWTTCAATIAAAIATLTIASF